MKDSLKQLLDQYPTFFNKSATSNFFKSQSVTNAQFQSMYQSLFLVIESLKLDKNCLIWKEQSAPYDYTINFVANFPKIKSVELYKNDTLIYSNTYDYEDDINSFTYAYTSSTSDEVEVGETADIIPQHQFKMKVQTFEEYNILKGFPENDEIENNEYDHDLSLDEIGALHNVPRKTYKLTDDYAHTEPPYNDRFTEDDYHYMNRILEYVLRLHTTQLPVLEIWKNYGIFADMINRKDYLFKMFDENAHPFNNETGLVEPWTPEVWEHKDSLCILGKDFGKFFFVSANTLLPVKNQDLKFSFKYLNSLGEDLIGDYSVTILLNDTVLYSNYTEEQIIIPNDVIIDDEENVFTFIAYDGESAFATEELIVNVRGCSNADWYVSPNGNDNNTGKSTTYPFATIEKALNMVNGEQNLIVLTSGTHNISKILNVPASCNILGCGNVTVNSSHGLKFFKVYQNQELGLQDMTLTYVDSEGIITKALFRNNNKNAENNLFVILPESDKISTTLTISTNKSTYNMYEHVTITGSLIENEEETGLSGKSIKIFVDNELVDTVTTLSTGSFTKQIRFPSNGTHSIKAIFEDDEDYASGTSIVSITVGNTYDLSILVDLDTTLVKNITCTNDGSIYYDVLNTEDITSMSDVNGTVCNIRLGETPGDIIYDTFSSQMSSLTVEDLAVLATALTSITCSNNGDIQYDNLGAIL